MIRPNEARERGSAAIVIGVVLALLLAGAAVYFFTLEKESVPHTAPTQTPVTQEKSAPRQPLAETPVSATPEPVQPAVSAESKPSAVSESQRLVRGRVVDEKSKPIADAHVYLFDDKDAAESLMHDGALLEAKSLELTPERWKHLLPYRTTRTATDGTFEVALSTEHTELATRGNLQLLATRGGYAPAQKSLDWSPTSMVLEVALTLESGFSISGRVQVADTLAPAPGMLVRVERVDGDGRRPRFMSGESVGEALVNEQGNYSLIGLPADVYRARVLNNATDFVGTPRRAAREVTLTPSTPQGSADFVVSLGGTIAGFVQSAERKPCSDARLMLLPANLAELQMTGGEDSPIDFMDLLSNRERNKTDESGQYEIRGVPLDFELSLKVSAEEFASPAPFRFKLTAEQRDIRRDFELQVGSSIAGRVHDERGKPVIGAQVRIAPELADLLAGAFDVMERDVKSDDSGHFLIEHLTASTYTLSTGEFEFNPFGGGGDSEADATRVKVKVDGIEHVRDVVLLQKTESAEAADASAAGQFGLSGTVVDADGQPIANANVAATSLQPGQQVFKNAQTDETGHFSISGLNAVQLTVTVKAEGFTTHKLKDVASGGRDELRIVLARPGKIMGRVVTPSGAVPELFTVTSRKVKEAGAASFLDSVEDMAMGGSPESSTRGAADGSFTLDNVPDGMIEVLVNAPGYATTPSEPIQMSPGQEVRDLLITLHEGASLTGTVIADGTGAISGASVHVRRIDDKDATQLMMERYMPDSSKGEGVVSDEDGNYQISNLVAGTYEVFAKHVSFAQSQTEQLVVTAEKVYRVQALRLSRGGGIQGVITQSDASPRKGLMVQLLSTDGQDMKTTDENGAFTFSNLAPGDYSVIVTDLSSMQSGNLDMKTRSVTLTGAEMLEMKIVYGVGRKVRGRINGLKLKPMQAIVLLRAGAPSTQELDYSNLAKAQTDMMKHSAGFGLLKPDGSFEIKDIEAGDYTLELPATPDNPMDIESYKTMDRTPLIRRTIKIGDTDLDLDITVP
ncbi:MAG: carboxypeptidase regulatory-like domain-containing protein [Planctomycetota bacterium]